MTRDELDGLNIVGTPDFALWDMAANPPRMIVAPGAIDPAYFYVLRSVSIAHIALKAQNDVLERLIEAAESVGLDSFVPAIMAAGSSIAVARQVACDGIEAVQERQPKGTANNG